MNGFRNITMGDIGENPHEIEFEPLPDTVPVEEPAYAPTPEQEPAQAPEKEPVPA